MEKILCMNGIRLTNRLEIEAHMGVEKLVL